ncbi:phosphotransferase family protein [Nesterenkonia salmonea]|uniref:Phosphotransferase family protein n=1 Tax=Nesterenkonia salmonea TaxID=1804987 RepID=A0A5R9BKD4_9MICC|nr:phosphotransferase family protein [Nesterenkonia salmonea]TLQ01077.1 phosphotransferase family protein [Nesterenkonia salmonea]
MTEVPGLDRAGLTHWLEATHPELAGDVLTASVIAGGRSNLTYRIDGATRPLVLRRPPLGHVLSSAHDMHREHKVIHALYDSAVPVPATIDVVDDTETKQVTGTPFFLMERVEGVVLSSPEQNRRFTPEALYGLGIQLAETLADLHGVVPADVGLETFGRPEGYLERQLATWRRQLNASQSRPQPELHALQDRLSAGRPASPAPAVVHGDFRLDNVLVTEDAKQPKIAAVLDWEMATLGDPLVDLGILGLYWQIGSLIDGPPAQSSIVPGAGYPEFAEIVDAYAARRGVLIGDLSWYRAFAAYKLAVILEGVHFRYRSGETVGTGFDHIGELVAPLAEDGLAHINALRS